MEYTQNYALLKPEGTDECSNEPLNMNADEIDRVMHEHHLELHDEELDNKLGKTETAAAAVLDGAGGNIAKQIEINRRTLGAQATKNVLKINALNQTKNGITITTNEDRSISIEGKATTETYFNINANVTVPSTANYTLTGCPSGGSNSTYQLYLTGDVEIYDKGKGDTKRITTSQKCTAYIAILPTDENLDITFYPMLRETDITDDTYEPYKPSLQEQINALMVEIAGLKTQITTPTTAE